MHPIDTDHLRTFVAIMDAGSFTKAAEAVAKTQSAVSMQMKKLEERIGRPLFERDGRMNRLTADGERLLPYARRMLKLQAEALSAFEGALSGSVRLGVPDDYAAFIPRILRPFLASHPLAEVAVVCEPTETLVQLLTADEIDIALVTYGPHLGLPATPPIVRREPLFWVGSERHTIAEDEPVRLAMSCAHVCDWARRAFEVLERTGRSYKVVFSTQNAAAVSEAVIAGLAVSVLPAAAAGRPGMRILTEADGFPPLPGCDIAMLVRPDRRHGLVGALADHVVESLTDRAPALVAA
jgi:DNA-binding transcriptional LysR family regulator